MPPLPRLGFPLWIPPSEAPSPKKVSPKGETHPSPPLRVRLRRSLFRGRMALSTVPGEPFGSRPLLFPRRDTPVCPLKGDSLGRRQRQWWRLRACASLQHQATLVRSVTLLAFNCNVRAFARSPARPFARQRQPSFLSGRLFLAPVCPQGRPLRERWNLGRERDCPSRRKAIAWECSVAWLLHLPSIFSVNLSTHCLPFFGTAPLS